MITTPQFINHLAGTDYQLLIIILLLSSLLYLQHQLKRRPILRWKKKLLLQKHQIVFKQLYKTINGFAISYHARQEQDAIDYIYGEIEFLPFIALLSLVKPNQDTVFYDLGCGVGKAVLACAMVYPIKKSVGVELLPPLHQCAIKQNQSLASFSAYADKSQKIDFILGDFLESDLEEATLIFVNASTITMPTWKKLEDKLDKLSALQTIITTSKTLVSEHFIIRNTTQIQMSWGIVPAYIYQKNEAYPQPN